MALEPTQPLTEMSTRGIPGGKGGRCVRLTTLPPPCTVVMKSGYLNFLEPFGSLQACNGTPLPLIIIYAYLCSEFGVRLFFEMSCILYLGRKMPSCNL